MDKRFNTPKPLTSSSHPDEQGGIRTGDTGGSDARDVRLGPPRMERRHQQVPYQTEEKMQFRVVNLCDLIARSRPIGALPLAPDRAVAAADPISSRIGHKDRSIIEGASSTKVRKNYGRGERKNEGSATRRPARSGTCVE
jgi:hypothetical protein